MTEINSGVPIFDGPQIGDPGVEMDQCGCCVKGRPRPEPTTTVTGMTYISTSIPAQDRSDWTVLSDRH